MNRARNFPPSAAFADLALSLAKHNADLECHPDQTDAGIATLNCALETTEEALLRKPVECVGDLLLKLEILANISVHSVVDNSEWQGIASDVERLNGAGLAFSADAWLRRWTNRGGGYVRTDTGVSFVAPEPPSAHHRVLMAELQRAQGYQAVVEAIDRAAEPQPVTPTISEIWEQAKADYSAAQAKLDEGSADQSDADCEAEIAAWDAMMMARAPDLDAVRHKFAELFWILHRDHYEPEDAWSDRFVAGVIADVARITREGGVA